MASTEQLIFEILAKDAQANAAFFRFRRTVDDTTKSVDRNSASIEKNTRSMDRSAQSNKSALGALVGLGVAFGPVTAGAAAAGAGVAAFGALAVPSIKKISTALTGPGGLAASWVTLDNRQRNAALGIQALGRDYSALARTLEPQVFQVFNQGLGLANSLLGPAGRLAHAAGLGFSDFLANFTSDSGIQQFVGFLSTQARPALDLLGADITHVSHAIFQLLQSFAGAGLLELRALTGVFTALDDAISFLSQHAPGLTSAGLAIGGIALALSKLGALSGALKITGISAIAGQLAGFSAATRGATLAEKGLLASSAALEAITPFGWAVLGAAALGGLVFWASRYKTVTDDSIASIEAQSKAQGFNTAGYFAASRAIQAANAQQQKQKTTLVNLHTGLTQGTVAVGSLTGATEAYSAAQRKLVSEGRNQDTFLVTLQQKYGLTRDAAISLARHAGVLASTVSKGGSAMHNALGQAEAYANSNLHAQRPVSQLAQDISDYSDQTLTATDRTKALSDALSQFFNPAVSADQAVITLRNDQQSLARALRASGGQTGFLTQKQRDARGAFDTYISDVASAAQAAFTATGRTSSYTGVINRALPFLERAAGHNKTLRQEIQHLIDTERGLRSEHVAISVSGTGSWSVRGGNTGGAGHPHPPGGPGFAAGGRIPGFGGGDIVPVLAEPGEAIVDKHRTRRYAGVLGAMGVPGFESGGVVGHYASHSIPGLDKWVRSENAATIRAISDSVAAAFKAAAPGPGSGGGHVGWHPGGGTAQWAPDVLSALKQLGLPSSYELLVLYQMMTECVPLRTRILTRRGWLAHDEVRVGDETIGYNPETGFSEWTAVTAVHHYGAVPTVRFGNKYWSAECTPNHRWLTESIGRVRCGGATAEKAAPPALTRFEDMRSRDRVILARKARTEGTLPITTREAALLGWIAGDGSVNPDGYIAVYQTKRHFFSAIDYACGADPMHRRYELRPDGSITWRLTAGYSQDLLKRAGHPKHDAVAQVLEMSTEQRDAWLDAMICAEGSIGEHKISIWQDDGPVADAIELAIYLSGQRPARVKVSQRAGHKQAWCFNETSPTVGGPGRNSFAEPAPAQEVWCVTTTLGSWTADQDGQVFLTGNSGGNPNIVNKWDSNWLAGHPSVGLMQVIAGTFQAYAGPYRNTGPFSYGVSVDPLANIYAALNYGAHNRGFGTGPGQIGSGHGYDNGGFLPPGLSLAWNGTGRPEPVIPAGRVTGSGSSRVTGSGSSRVEELLSAVIGRLDMLADVTAASADDTASGVGAALGIAGSRWAMRNRYSPV